MGNMNNRVDCYQCKHFTVSWDPKFPRCCKLYDFKTAALPSVVVYNSSGEICMGFEKKEAPR